MAWHLHINQRASTLFDSSLIKQYRAAQRRQEIVVYARFVPRPDLIKPRPPKTCLEVEMKSCDELAVKFVRS